MRDRTARFVFKPGADFIAKLFTMSKSASQPTITDCRAPIEILRNCPRSSNACPPEHMPAAKQEHETTDFSQRLSQLRKERGLTQQALATMVCMGITQINRYEGDFGG